MPLPNTAVIHPAWSQVHRPAAESAMRSRVEVLKPLADAPEPTFPPSDEGWDPVAAVDVPARVRALAQGNSLAPSGQSNDSADYLVQIPADALEGLLVGADGHRIRVTSNPGSPDVEGRTFTILGIQHETESFNRDLLCREHTTQEQR